MHLDDLLNTLYTKGSIKTSERSRRIIAFENLPNVLSAEQLAQVLGISRAGAYQLLHTEGFPTLRIGKRMLVSKDKLMEWIDVVAAVVAMFISMLGVPIATMNTFAFGIRCAGPFAAYGLGLVVPNATKNAGIVSLVAGTVGFCFWQWLTGGDLAKGWGILPVVFGCAISAIAFFLVNSIERKRGVAPAPSAYID